MLNKNALVFDVLGQLAHFRAYYTNASSITYGFPPRTVIAGMIGAIIGYERNSYYEDLSPSNSKIAVSVLTPVRKYIQTINYIKTKGFKGFKSFTQHYLERKIETYPTSVEFAVPKTDLLKYRIYFNSDNLKIYERLKDYLQSKRSYYSIYLGITELLADLEFVGEFIIEEPLEGKGLTSVVPEELFSEIGISNDLSLVVEKMPVNFELEKRNFRKLSSTRRYIYERNAKRIPLNSLKGIVSINGENVAWM